MQIAVKSDGTHNFLDLDFLIGNALRDKKRKLVFYMFRIVGNITKVDNTNANPIVINEI